MLLPLAAETPFIFVALIPYGYQKVILVMEKNQLTFYLKWQLDYIETFSGCKYYLPHI